MSHSASIDLHLARPLANVSSALSSLKQAGWKADDGGEISYLPLGDDGDFDWRSAPLDEGSLVDTIVQSKERAGELVGIVLTWEDSGVGGQFLFNPDHRSVNVVLSNNRKLLDGCERFTDLSWYLSRILPAFVGCIESLTCEEAD